MKKSGNKVLPHFTSLDELVNFFDTHDMGEFCEQMPEVDFEVDIRKENISSPLMLKLPES